MLQSMAIYMSSKLLLSSDTSLQAQVVLKGAVVVNVLKVATILEDAVVSLGLSILILHHVGETPSLTDDDLLTTSELVTRTAESFDNNSTVALTAANREKHLSDIDTGNTVIWLSESTSHTSLQAIGTST